MPGLRLILLLPALVLAWTINHGLLTVLIALIFAYDTVLMHGNELSDAEFHESRCDYWLKRGRDVVKFDRAVRHAAAREYAKRHPDKGRTDALRYSLLEFFRNHCGGPD